MPFHKWLRAALKLPCLPAQSAGRHQGGQAMWRPVTPSASRIVMSFGEEDGGLDIWSDLAKKASEDGFPSKRRNGCDTHLVSSAAGGASTRVPAVQEVAQDGPVPARATILPRAGPCAAPEPRRASGAPSTAQGESAARPRPWRKVRFAPNGTGSYRLGERYVPSIEAPATPAWSRIQPGRPRGRASGSRGIRLPTIYKSPSAQPSARRRIPPRPAIAWDQATVSPVGWPGRTAAAPKPASRPQSHTAARTQWQRQHQHGYGGGANSMPPPSEKWEEPPLGEMSRESVFAVVNAVGKLIPHLPFAVCGRAALVYYGHPGHRPSHVSVVCPERAAAILIGWARASGLRLSTHFPQAFYVAAPHHGGAGVGCVRVLSCRDFERLGHVRRGPSATPVLTFPHMADRMAGQFYEALAAGDEAASRAADLIWMLGRIVEVGGNEQRLTLDRAPVFGCATFLEHLTRRYPEAISLMREAGLTLRSLPGLQTRALSPRPAAPVPGEMRRSTPTRPGSLGQLGSRLLLRRVKSALSPASPRWRSSSAQP